MTITLKASIDFDMYGDLHIKEQASRKIKTETKGFRFQSIWWAWIGPWIWGRPAHGPIHAGLSNYH